MIHVPRQRSAKKMISVFSLDTCAIELNLVRRGSEGKSANCFIAHGPRRRADGRRSCVDRTLPFIMKFFSGDGGVADAYIVMSGGRRKQDESRASWTIEQR